MCKQPFSQQECEREDSMVESRLKKHGHFTVFILPCVILYGIFFVYPFFSGISISLTNWDGLTPKAPISISAQEFERDILAKTDKTTDKRFLLSVYRLDEETATYSRMSVSGLTRKRIEWILASADYSPERNRFVGLQNFRDVLTGKAKDTFYPRKYTEVYYNPSSSLPSRIPVDRAEKEILKNAGADSAALFADYYEKTDEAYVLRKQFNSYDIEDLIWTLPEYDSGALGDTDIDTYIRSIVEVSLTQNTAEKNRIQDAFLSEQNLGEESRDIVRSATARLYNLGTFKNALSGMWVAEKIKMGVVGFTLFFAFFSVIGINILAFALALVLDSGLSGQKIFRTIFFLPNVLSMIIVALIWKMLFYQILPAITGTDLWLSDAAKAPWLLVLVAVWQGCGYYMIVYLAGLQNIPSDVTEAALIDGANRVQRFRYITLPLIVPAITISLFLTIANALKSFDLIYAMVGPSGYATSTVPFVLDIYYEAFAQRQAGMATSKALLLFMVILCITGIQLYVMKRREVEN